MEKMAFLCLVIERDFKREWIMMRFVKGINIALIFITTHLILGLDFSYSLPDYQKLRVPLLFSVGQKRQIIPNKISRYLSPQINKIQEESGNDGVKYFYAVGENGAILGELAIDVDKRINAISIINIGSKIEGKHIAKSLVGYIASLYPGYKIMAPQVLSARMISIFESLFEDYIFDPLYLHLRAEVSLSFADTLQLRMSSKHKSLDSSL
ncbi:MAG: hypothetical protein KKD11_01390 [Candidatus Omnitrophica bacterium]|nr:hypothetical protein [Candidatus Omnitrophota bacterium]